MSKPTTHRSGKKTCHQVGRMVGKINKKLNSLMESSFDYDVLINCTPAEEDEIWDRLNQCVAHLVEVEQLIVGVHIGYLGELTLPPSQNDIHEQDNRNRKHRLTQENKN